MGMVVKVNHRLSLHKLSKSVNEMPHCQKSKAKRDPDRLVLHVVETVYSQGASDPEKSRPTHTQ